jgi:plasmid stabilization system protein ParE
MANKVILSRQAEKDLARIEDSNTLFAGIEYAHNISSAIAHDLLNVAQNSLISGSPVQGLDAQYRKWTMVKNRYVVYFRRTRQKNLRVITIRSAKEKPLTPTQILQADK